MSTDFDPPLLAEFSCKGNSVSIPSSSLSRWSSGPLTAHTAPSPGNPADIVKCPLPTVTEQRPSGSGVGGTGEQEVGGDVPRPVRLRRKRVLMDSPRDHTPPPTKVSLCARQNMSDNQASVFNACCAYQVCLWCMLLYTSPSIKLLCGCVTYCRELRWRSDSSTRPVSCL